MKRLIPVFFLLIFFLACSDSRPKGVLSSENMVKLLTDMHIVDGYANRFQTDSMAQKTYHLYQAIFLKYNTDSLTLKKSIEFYTAKPDVLKEIYVKVTTNLDNMQKAEQKRLDDIRVKEEKARQDSIKKVEKVRQDSIKKVKKVRQDSIKKVNDKKKKEELQKKFKSKKIMKIDSTKKQGLKK